MNAQADTVRLPDFFVAFLLVFQGAPQQPFAVAQRMLVVNACPGGRQAPDFSQGVDPEWCASVAQVEAQKMIFIPQVAPHAYQSGQVSTTSELCCKAAH